MAVKVVVILSLLALAIAGHVEPHYSPASSVSYSSFSSGPTTNTAVASGNTFVTPLSDTKSYIQPAPIYESSSEDLKLKALNLNTHGNAYTTYKNYDDSSVKDVRLLTHAIPTFYSSSHANPTAYHLQSDYSISSPVHTVSAPTHVAYTTHNSPATKSISFPSLTSYTTSDVARTPGLATYASHASVGDAPVKTIITYSEAPLVSHMSFSGLGTSYSW